MDDTTPEYIILIQTFAPVIIVLLFCGTIGIAFYAGGQRAHGIIEPYSKAVKEKLERAGIVINAQLLQYAIPGGTLILWAIIVLIFRLPLILSFAALPVLLFAMFQIVSRWVEYRIKQRQAKFVNQLESVLRVMSSGVRAGLTIRQAMVLVTEEAPEPAKYEFKLLIVQTNVGVGMSDALNRMAQRMPSPEVEMFARSLNLQAQTGGNLAKVLDQLCDTIKERRRIFRKVKTITSEARGSAWVLGSLPIFAFIMILCTLPTYRYPTFHSLIGLEIIGAGTVLEVFVIFILYKLTQFKV